MISLACKLILASMLCTVVVNANPIDIIKQHTESGQPFIRLVNNTNKLVYCTIIGFQNKYFKDFYIRPHTKGRWYIEPIGYYEYNCR